MAYELFKLSDDGEIVINKIAILTIPAFKKILRRDESRSKTQAFKEFAYIYHIADSQSVPNKNGQTDKEAHAYASNMAGLGDYKADAVVIEAVRIYEIEDHSEAKDTIMELLRIYAFTKKIFVKVRQSIELSLIEDELSTDKTNELLGKISTVIDYGNKIPQLTKDLQKAIRDLEIEDDNINLEILRGTDEVVPSSADPKRQL